MLAPQPINSLLSIMDRIENERDDKQLSRRAWCQIVAEQTRAKKRPICDVLQLLTSAGWVVVEPETLNLTPHYHEFMAAWNTGNLFYLNQNLASYLPYRQFLSILQKEKALNRNKKARQKLADQLNMTDVAFETFCVWSLAVGQAYQSPFSNTLYWGGNWNVYSPSLETFKSSCWDAYRKADKTSGYAHIASLAETVCRQLHISFQLFESKWNQLVKNEPHFFRLAQATARWPERDSYMVTIRPRAEILRERAAARLGGASIKPRWLEYRHLEDGIRLDKIFVKLIRWELFL